jgi:phenylpropionate dioxygenase-like ring-hydroxylating dioxygenase large terminal subunit
MHDLHETRQSETPVFPKNMWYVAFWSADLNDSALHPRRILGEPIVFYRTDSGAVVALEDTCPHRFAPLSLGKLVDGDRVECAYHGLRFDRAGACVFNPHTDHKIPPAAKVRSYPVVEKYSLVWIWMGSGVPDADAIPEYECLDTARPEHISTRNYMTIEADYRLIVDNLLDLSHVPFLHAGVLTGTVDDEINVTQNGNTVTIARWSYDVPVPSLTNMMFRNDSKNVDSWLLMHWRPAGCMILDTGVREPGTAKEDGTGYYGLHMLTPESATSTHYHFAAVRFNAPPRTLEEDLAIRETISVGRKYAFEAQDAPVIEAQQRRMNEIGGRRPALLAVDAGVVRVQRVLSQLIAAENGASPQNGTASAERSTVLTGH